MVMESHVDHREELMKQCRDLADEMKVEIDTDFFCQKKVMEDIVKIRQTQLASL